MNNEKFHCADQWFDSTFVLLNESYQLDLRRIVSTDISQLLNRLSDFYMYDPTALLVHLLGLTSHYLHTSSYVYADNQLRHKLNMHLLLIARDGYERASLVEHIKQGVSNVHSIRQTGKCFDYRRRSFPNIFCSSSESNSSNNNGFCLSDHFDEHGMNCQHSSTKMSTSNGRFIRQLLNKKDNEVNTDCLMIFLASKPRLYSQRLKMFDFNRYPSLEHWIMAINCLASDSIDFFFEQIQANQLLCDYLDKLSLKSKSLENDHPCLSARYLSAREHVLRLSALLYLLQMTVENLFLYRQTFHSFGQPDKTFYDNLNSILEQTRSLSNTRRVVINCSIVQSAIYFVDICLIQFERMFEPVIMHFDHLSMSDDSHSDRTSSSPPVKRLKTMVDPSYLRSLELAHELLLLPFVAFTRTSVYSNSKIKRFAIYLDSVIDELKKSHLILPVRQGVQMVDGTRRRVDLLVKYPPHLEENESCDHDLMERLNRFNVDYDQYIQTLGTLDISEKYRLSDRCYSILNSVDYQRYLTVNLERFAPIHRVQTEGEDEINETWGRTTPKIEQVDSDS